MTRKRNDKHSTEFGLWIREQDEVRSSIGFVATNLDFIWSNYKTKEWMLIEEKRYMTKMTYPQSCMFKTLHTTIKSNSYKGFFLIQFEKTNPLDGGIFINNIKTTTNGLIQLLSFDKKLLRYFSNVNPL